LSLYSLVYSAIFFHMCDTIRPRFSSTLSRSFGQRSLYEYLLVLAPSLISLHKMWAQNGLSTKCLTIR
jgi:hypothetical protein